MPNHLFDALSFGLRRDPAKTFAVDADGKETSYGEFFAGSLRIARTLVDCGLEPNDRVAVQAEKSLNVLQLYLGTVAAGGVLLPISPGCTAVETRYFLADASPRFLICAPEKNSELAGTTEYSELQRVWTLKPDGKGTLLAQNTPAGISFDPVSRQPDELAALLYTSGTTGRPKGAMLSHGALASNYSTMKQLWRFTEDDVLIHFLPINHVHGLFVATNIALMAGCSLILFPKFDADAIIRTMPHATAMMGVPTHYIRLLKHGGLSRQTASGMRLFVSGSAPLLATTHREWERRTGHRILERYGMTEANMITSHRYDGRRKPGSVGSPIPGVKVRIRADSGKTVTQPDEIGSLEVKSPGLFSGYWGLAGQTGVDLGADGWFRTGDLARYDSEGEVVLEGRAKDLVISGGVNIYPKELENVIDSSPEVSESAVVGVPHPDFGEAVVAFVVGAGGESRLPEAVSSWLDGRLARYKHPKRVIFLDNLPRNSMGKVQKSVLRSDYRDLFGNSQSRPN